jgi:hypothetical protein
MQLSIRTGFVALRGLFQVREELLPAETTSVKPARSIYIATALGVSPRINGAAKMPALERTLSSGAEAHCIFSLYVGALRRVPQG